MKKSLLIMMILIMSYISVAQAAISNLVIPVSYFADHIKQLTLVKNNLIKYRQTSLVGISGMGKTQLARMHAYENKNNYELIWFIDCNLDINEEFLKLAKSINEKAKTNLISKDVGSAKKEVLSYLSSKDKWLLVFDNLKIKENHKVQEFINWEHNGHVIFASQDSELLPNIIVKMTVFDKDDAITLANNILEKDDPKLAEFLVQEFVGYPVLIVQGTQLLNQVPGLSQEEYKKRIRDSADKIKLNITLAIKELKPDAKRLLNKIALINNQAFSKELLKIIADDKNTIDDDIYQLSKFALISNTDPNETNPVFEMHDVIAQKIAEMRGIGNNINDLEEIVTKLINSVPKSVMRAHVFEEAKTMRENLEIIAANTQKYNINIYKLMKLNLQLIIRYVNFLDIYNSEKLISWFNKNDKKGKFKLWLMNNDTKSKYACYLGLIGTYYISCTDHYMAINYFTRAREVFDNVKGYGACKCNIFYFLAISNIHLGKIQEAEENIQVMQQMFTDGLVEKRDIGYIYGSKARLLFVQGKYLEALEQINKTIEMFIKNGLQPDDLFLTSSYIRKAAILNSLNQYQEAYAQAKQVYDMHKIVKKEDHEVFGRIFTQMSRAELGLGNAQEALGYAQKAIVIFINDSARSNKDISISSDTYLAKAFVAEGDALAALGQNEKVAESYASAEVLYYNNYRDNMKNVDGVSYLYWAAAKATCNLPNKFWYTKFSTQLIEKFGETHFRSIDLLSKCKN
ncbi:tetratricopeptide repeat protein [Candidatus Tisiphia endosymbiont of Nedyus quadrimaculatus]|uniref:tetratricopeptide repeat protein n=1 Tax=Candidatus Tisiphia endosymbiont of Nedyus quadrimaculatus TaxID=3139332 RepID=UPI00345EDE5E